MIGECAYRSGARELREESLPEMDVQLHHMHIAHHSSHADVNSSEVKIFFTLSDLKVENKMALYLPIEDHSNYAHFLPREEADSFPFSFKQLPYILELTFILRDSPQAKAMEDTLRMCKTDPIKDEIKTCATSLESMLDFAGSILGSETSFKTVTTKSTSNTFQNFTILEVQEISAPKMILGLKPGTIPVCHYFPTDHLVFVPAAKDEFM
ncbi:BURP domain-containing protein USPL1 [Citrus sinensis]|uniref:BURP domain-containing protein USPL1 n=1 Tax=Citrus sinensis TaxID=2711 RepID=A0ACB8IGJ4_CITSI|nr:BURP domain-containing protein USPL1 [Citrus sinensis]